MFLKFRPGLYIAQPGPNPTHEHSYYPTFASSETTRGGPYGAPYDQSHPVTHDHPACHKSHMFTPIPMVLTNGFK